MLTSFKRIIRSGFVGFWRSAFVSLSAIFVMTVTLIVIGSMILLGQLLDSTLTQVKDKVDINVYMVTTADEQMVLDLKESLDTLPEVSEVTYTSREQELTNFRERHRNDELTIQALEELGENPFGAKLSVRAIDPSRYESIDNFLDQYKENEAPDTPLIDRVNYSRNQEAIDKLTEIIDTVEEASLITMLVLVVSSILIAFNTIRLAIYTAREEIGVMRLVGASNMFIRGPFILQGIMYGLISGILTLLVLYPVVLWLGPQTAEFFLFNIFEYFVQNFAYLFAVIVGSGVVLGMISSTLAIARHLRV